MWNSNNNNPKIYCNKYVNEVEPKLGYPSENVNFQTQEVWNKINEFGKQL